MENPNRLVSLWDMLRNYGFRFFGVGMHATLSEIEDGLPARSVTKMFPGRLLKLLGWGSIERGESTSNADKEQSWIRMLIELCANCGLKQSAAYLSGRMESGHLRAGFQKMEAHYFKDLLANELRDMQFMYVPPQLAKLYNSPEEFFGQGTLYAFPSITEDAAEACRCLALGRSTGAVFHAMRAAEVALRALAADRGVQYPDASLKSKQVGDLLSALDGKLADLRKSDAKLWPSKDIKDAQIKFYHTAIAEFRDFNEAWRKHMAHAHESSFYDSLAAQSILGHVSQFMKVLAGKVSESATTPLYWIAD